MLRRSAVSLGFFSVVREELAKLPAYLSFKMKDSAQQHVDSVNKTFDFLKGESPSDTPEMREKRRKHKEMYDALMREQQAQAAALKEKQRTNRAAMSFSEKAKALAAEAKEALAQMTSAKAGAMALLQHCTASHAAEVAVEQGVDVKNVRMVLEKQQKPNSVEYEEVVVGYIDAPTASEEELFVFAEKLQKACPVANSMHIDWKRDPGDLPVSRSGSASEETYTSSGGTAAPNAKPAPSVDFQTFASQGMDSFQEPGTNTATPREVPSGMPGSRRYGGGFMPSSGLGHGVFGEDDALHLPGVKPRDKSKGASQTTPETPYGMPGYHRLRTDTGSVPKPSQSADQTQEEATLKKSGEKNKTPREKDE